MNILDRYLSTGAYSAYGLVTIVLYSGPLSKGLSHKGDPADL